MQIIVLHKQSLFDVCLQHTGSIAGIFELAEANNLSITDDVQAGQRLELPPLGGGKGEVVQDADILAYYTAKNIQPATALEEYTEQLEGISYWTINQNFKVS
ncbi:hypothetical protein EQP59_07100 [Ornithobacterium rhinotracheale]|uniref:LysM domain-containing protein n=1 Tax=Ornithobacterium rhinotracheale TaxID=28251 RepID=A0A410JSJ9_ORNRH|nr:hypothetical protein [Ornithobacterium rhinotracheale]QAR31112.1 hypothetical protein EQP59_07100 [Ornithobacterium rhinotracheale]